MCSQFERKKCSYLRIDENTYSSADVKRLCLFQRAILKSYAENELLKKKDKVYVHELLVVGSEIPPMILLLLILC